MSAKDNYTPVRWPSSHHPPIEYIDGFPYATEVQKQRRPERLARQAQRLEAA